MEEYEELAKTNKKHYYPRLVLMITGKGPEKE